MLEAFDTYNKLYVPSLKGQRFRDKRNIQRCETRKVDEDQYAQKTFPQNPVNEQGNSDIQDIKRWLMLL